MTEDLRQQVHAWQDGEKIDAPLDVYRCTVIQEWVDYNNHMTEAAYLTVFGWASDVLFQFIGVDDAYRAGGSSFYTVETHIIYEREAALNDSLKVILSSHRILTTPPEVGRIMKIKHKN